VKVVLSWLRELAPTEMEADELAELITQRGVKVEEVLRPWDGLDGVVVARVLDVADHPHSDKLCVARVDDGTGEQVVCAGVRNFAAGDLVPWAKPGSRVPVLDQPLAPRSLRGVVSNGMLCSLRELAIADTHEGILILEPSEGFEVGDDVKRSLALDDAVFDIEVEPNRPDFLSVLGVAREVAAAVGECGVLLGDDVEPCDRGRHLLHAHGLLLTGGHEFAERARHLPHALYDFLDGSSRPPHEAPPAVHPPQVPP